MPKNYFEEQENKNKGILIELLKAVVKGIISISTLRIDKNMTGGGYRLTAFIREKSKSDS